MKFNLPRNVMFILDRFNDAGYAAYVVGGPVRDLLRGVTPSDYDITTSASPSEIKALFSDIRTVDTGIKHGTVTLVIDSEPYEVTTYRIDGEYLDARHPSGVEFTDKLELDLLRRDFTMNAIAYNPGAGLVDTTGGIADIEAKIIRCVGEPSLRFSEDALRILRALRFSATLGFEIEERTADAIFALKANLDFVSGERIYAEIKKMLSGEFLSSVISGFMPVLSFIIPEWEGIEDPESLKPSCDYLTNLIALFAISGTDADSFAERMRDLRADGATVKAGVAVLSALGKYPLDKKEGLIDLCLDFGAEYARLCINVATALSLVDSSTLCSFEEILKTTPLTLKELDISGNDLSEAGLVGEEIGRTLARLLRSAALGEIQNTKDALLSVAKSAEK